MSSDETVSDVGFSKAVNIGFNYKSQGNDEWSYHSLPEHASGIQTVQTSVLSPRHLHYWVRIPLLPCLVPQPACCLSIVWLLGSILTINRQWVSHLVDIRYVLKIHFFIESGRKMIQFKIQFKTKSKIFIQKNIHSIESRIFNRIIHS